MKVLLVCLMIVCLSWGSSLKTRNAWKRSSGLTCNCGWRNTGRIVGGKETRKNEYPWMVSLSNGCGGSIITPYHVLTAAHCTDGWTANSITISVGRHYQNGKNGHLQQHRLAKIIQHENFIGEHLIYDISVLVLAKPITFNQYVGPVCMPTSRFDLDGKFIKITGWGMTKGTGDQNVLREVDAAVVPNKSCKRSWPKLDSRPTQICVHTPVKNACFGDSGGPLVLLDPASNRYTQVALVSFGPEECGRDPRPSVHTDVFAYDSWIKKAIARSKPEARICTKA